MNITATVGTGVQFNRLIRAVDDWAARHPEHTVYVQGGYSDYKPVHVAKSFGFIPFTDFQKYLDLADVLVAHGSAGPILAARRRGIPIVLVPRQPKFGEMPNEHQVEICEAIRGESAMREIVLDIAHFDVTLQHAIDKRRSGAAYEPHLLKDRLVATMAAFLENVERD